MEIITYQSVKQTPTAQWTNYKLKAKNEEQQSERNFVNYEVIHSMLLKLWKQNLINLQRVLLI